MKSNKRLVLCSVLALTLLLWAAPVLAMPPIPHAFYGTVTINGEEDAPIGTVVSASIKGEDAGSYTITVPGEYGNLDNRDYLGVSSANANDGDTITFYVRGVFTSTSTFDIGGGPTEKNLVLTITSQSITGEVVDAIAANQTGHIVDASAIANTTITVSTTAEVTVTVKKYYDNPHPEATLPATMVPRYIDIEVSNLDAIVWPMYVKQTYTDAEVAGVNESSLGMYYFKAGAWNRCSDTGVNMGDNYIWADMIRDELGGSPVATGGTALAPEPTPAGGGGGGGGGVDTTAPTISVISVPKITETTADISWRTSEASTSQVEYWTSPAKLSPLDTKMVFAHLVHLTDLTPGTIYYYKAMSKDEAGNLAISDEDRLTTLGVAPAAVFARSDLSITPGEVNVGETVTITALITNTGNAAGDYVVTLKINGEVETTREVTLDATASKVVTFTTSRDVADSYLVAVNGLSGSFTVKGKPVPAPPPPPPAPPPEVKAVINWPVVGGIIAAVVVVGLLIFFLIRRTKRAA